jgi:hypothetical protein
MGFGVMPQTPLKGHLLDDVVMDPAYLTASNCWQLGS